MTTMAEAEGLLPAGRMLIGEQWVSESSGGTYVHVNPTTGKPHPAIPMAGTAEVDAAVQAARRAFPGWRAMPVDARRDVLLRLAGLLRTHAGELAQLVMVDNGSPSFLAQAGPRAAADNFTYFAGWVDKVGGEVIPVWPAPALDYAVLEPYGVVGAIMPWNVPLYNIGQVAGAALAAGNCLVLKAPELAPFSVIRFGELVLEAGIPAGVVNILPGGAECGSAMVAHPGIDKLHYIGGGAVARQIMRAAAETLKPVTMELGGKSANLVFADADLADSARIAAFHGLGNSGQGCLVPSRLLVEDSIYDQFVPMVLGVVQQMKQGNPFDDGVLLGPVITEGAADRILGVIGAAESGGHGTLLTGGERLGGELADGFFVAPTVFGDVDNASGLAQEEIFGPVLSIIRFSDEEEAIALANDTEFGLAAYAHTTDLKRAHRVAAALEAGSVWINGSGLQVAAPFGGMKQSGFGRMGGRQGLEDFLRPKNVYVSLA